MKAATVLSRKQAELYVSLRLIPAKSSQSGRDRNQHRRGGRRRC